jgi:hypothetical protein
LQIWAALQVVVQVCVPVSQAWPAGQSPVPLQPQAPPPETATHSAPVAAPHEVHMAPPFPH